MLLIGVGHVIINDFKKIWKIGLVAIDKFTHNIQLKANLGNEVIDKVETRIYKLLGYRNQRVVLKCIYNSQDNIAEFLREVESHVIANLGGSREVIRCYGITKNPEKNEYMMIMQHGINGSLRQYLDKNFSSLNWILKLDMLQWMSSADEVIGLFYDYKREIVYNENTEICKQVEEVEEINKNLPSLTANTDTLSYTIHPQAIYTSRILDFKDLPESI
ncbi:uncharacterized protein OCT59_014204 [Rhizophagus irregularis]|uniref:uncharacterized protein n=1 Tax=Rhizophagus irregularis TaxID=588596 RepID=UPI00331A360F|nr:hypothetical protein OCT59_014204 [Rhizophagus irregularis]